MSAKDYVYQLPTVLLILERHRNKGTTSRQVKQAIWQAEQALRAMHRVTVLLQDLDVDHDHKWLEACAALKAINTVMLPPGTPLANPTPEEQQLQKLIDERREYE